MLQVASNQPRVPLNPPKDPKFEEGKEREDEPEIRVSSNHDGEEYPIISLVEKTFAAKNIDILKKGMDFFNANLDEEERLECINQQDLLGNTALHTCFEHYAAGHYKFMDQIADANKGKKPFDEILEKEARFNMLFEDILKILVGLGCDTKVLNLQGKTALQHSISLGKNADQRFVLNQLPAYIIRLNKEVNIDFRSMLSQKEQSIYLPQQQAANGNAR